MINHARFRAAILLDTRTSHALLTDISFNEGGPSVTILLILCRVNETFSVQEVNFSPLNRAA